MKVEKGETIQIMVEDKKKEFLLKEIIAQKDYENIWVRIKLKSIFE